MKKTYIQPQTLMVVINTSKHMLTTSSIEVSSEIYTDDMTDLVKEQNSNSLWDNEW